MSQENHEEGLLLEEKKEIRQIIDELIVKIEEYTSTTSLINNVNLTKKIETRGRKKKLTNKIREKHQCSECEFSTAKRLSLKKHIILKHSDKIVEPFKCEFCDKVFKDPGQLNNHRNVHIGFKPFKCNKCKLNFTTKGELIRHTRYKHTLERPHKCTYCDYSSVELSKLKRHIRVHTGERPYLCPHCDYASRDTFKLKRHLRIHTGEKPYECPVCKHSFSQSNSLKMHMKKSHASISSKTSTINRSDIFSLQQIKATSELSTIKNLENQLNDLQEASNLDIVLIDNTTDMFECKVCCMKFLTNKLLNEHSVEHTGERLFECKICAVRFTHKFALRSHTLSHDVEYSESLKLKLKLINQTTEIANSQMQTGVRAIDENYDKPSRGIMNFQNEGKIGDQQRCKLIETQSEDLAKKDESIKINDGVAKSNQDEANKSDNKINQFPEENFKFKVGQNKRKIHNSENSFVVINNSRKHQLDSTLIKNTNENSSMNNKCKFCFKNYASASNLKRHMKQAHEDFKIDPLTSVSKTLNRDDFLYHLNATASITTPNKIIETEPNPVAITNDGTNITDKNLIRNKSVYDLTSNEISSSEINFTPVTDKNKKALSFSIFSNAKSSQSLSSHLANQNIYENKEKIEKPAKKISKTAKTTTKKNKLNF